LANEAISNNATKTRGDEPSPGGPLCVGRLEAGTLVLADGSMPQLQHNMWVTNAKEASLSIQFNSIITGGGKWVRSPLRPTALYQHLLLTAERKFWRCVENGEAPRLFGAKVARLGLCQIRNG
jgi:hypothetical protein